jgi:hypothetical protein
MDQRDCPFAGYCDSDSYTAGAGRRPGREPIRSKRVPVDAKLAWSSTFKDFAVPAKFGEIVFSSRSAR